MSEAKQTEKIKWWIWQEQALVEEFGLEGDELTEAILDDHIGDVVIYEADPNELSRSLISGPVKEVCRLDCSSLAPEETLRIARLIVSDHNGDTACNSHEALAIEAVDGVPDDQLRPGILAEAMRLLKSFVDWDIKSISDEHCTSESVISDLEKLSLSIPAFLSGNPIPEDPKLTKALELLRRFEELDSGNDKVAEYLYRLEILCQDNAAFRLKYDTVKPNSQVTNHQCKGEADHE
jgi:hypothetical protein